MITKEILYSLILQKYGIQRLSHGCEMVASWMTGNGFKNWTLEFVEWFITMPHRTELGSEEELWLIRLFSLKNFDHIINESM